MTGAHASRQDGSLLERPPLPHRGDRHPHLLHVFPSFNIGGAQVRFAALAAGMAGRFRHTVISLSGNYDAAALIAPDAPVAYAPPPSSEGPLIERLNRLHTWLTALRPDLLLTYNWGAMEVALANNLAGLPHVHMEDGFGPEEVTRQFPRRVWARRLGLSNCQVIVPSRTLQAIATDTWRLRPDRVRYIPNGVSEAPARSCSADAMVLGLPRETPRIVWVGALRAEKNPLRLLRAFAPLKERAVLLVVGDGPQRGPITDEAARLELNGSLRLIGPSTDTRRIIMGADILALSSDTEQMPFAVLEAMSAGLPIASTDVGDVRNMVAPENAPFIVPICDAALGAALQTLAQDGALRARIGAANRARQQDRYNLPGMIEAHTAVFDLALKRARRAANP